MKLTDKDLKEMLDYQVSVNNAMRSTLKQREDHINSLIDTIVELNEELKKLKK